MAFVEQLQRYGDKVRYSPEDETGILDLAVILGHPRDDTLIYCCGPEPLLAAVEAHAVNWPPGALRLERFSPRIAWDSGGAEEFQVVLARSNRQVSVPSDHSILDAVRAAGVNVESSCREGVCGTCEVAVREGIPDHRDSVLDEDERKRNDCMMICVSRARSERLVLDL